MDGRILAAVILGGILGAVSVWARIRAGLSGEEWAWLRSFYRALRNKSYMIMMDGEADDTPYINKH